MSSTSVIQVPLLLLYCAPCYNLRTPPYLVGSRHSFSSVQALCGRRLLSTRFAITWVFPTWVLLMAQDGNPLSTTRFSLLALGVSSVFYGPCRIPLTPWPHLADYCTTIVAIFIGVFYPYVIAPRARLFIWNSQPPTGCSH